MKNVRWSDNGGTVGSTSIHAHMRVQDMRNLLRWCPNGHFTPTFPSAWGPHKQTTPELVEHAMGKADMNDGSYGYYFAFKLDGAGRILLDMLGFNWMEARFAREAVERYGA